MDFSPLRFQTGYMKMEKQIRPSTQSVDKTGRSD